MNKKLYFVTFLQNKRKVATGRILSENLEDAKLDAEFKMLLHHPVIMYDEVTAEEIQ